MEGCARGTCCVVHVLLTFNDAVDRCWRGVRGKKERREGVVEYDVGVDAAVAVYFPKEEVICGGCKGEE